MSYFLFFLDLLSNIKRVYTSAHNLVFNKSKHY